MVLTGKDIEFKNENVVKEDMDQGGSEIVQTGENGFEVSRERVLITNGKETSRIKEGSSVIKDPVKQITNVGSKAVVRSVDTGPESLDYYRVEEVYATSYSPCRQGYPDCRKSTASGTPLAKGVIAVTPKWYKIFGGTHIYIPGYGVGTVADTGGGIPGKYWIDLGYGEEDFVNWHQTVTIYFLNPAPANVPEVLP
jgi:3D (Asp-Asp-Asp) domain-containing protein